MKENLSNKDHIEILDNAEADLKSKKRVAKMMHENGKSNDEIEDELLTPINKLLPKKINFG